jgi:hypothetical protein
VHRGLELEKGGQRPSEGHAPLGKLASPHPGTDPHSTCRRPTLGAGGRLRKRRIIMRRLIRGEARISVVPEAAWARGPSHGDAKLGR